MASTKKTARSRSAHTAKTIARRAKPTKSAGTPTGARKRVAPKATPKLAAMTPQDRAYVASDLLPVKTAAQIVPLDFKCLTYRVTQRNRAIVAMGAVLQREGWYPFEAVLAACRETQREEIAASNIEALEASKELL